MSYKQIGGGWGNFEPGTKLRFAWDWDDFKRLCPNLTNDQLKRTIKRLYDEYNSNMGMNDELIRMIGQSVAFRDGQQAVYDADQILSIEKAK